MPFSNHKAKAMNRKHITYSDYYQLDSVVYPINTTSISGCFTPILKAGISQLNIAYEKWGRVMVYFFGLHQAEKTDDSKAVSSFINDRLKYHLAKRYNMDEVGYLWVREIEKAKGQHYHMVLFLDGDKIQHPQALAHLLKKLWEAKTGQTISYVKNSFYYVTNPDQLSAFKGPIERLSYLAKERGKGYRLPQAKDYQASRLKSKQPTKETQP